MIRKLSLILIIISLAVTNNAFTTNNSAKSAAADVTKSVVVTNMDKKVKFSSIVKISSYYYAPALEVLKLMGTVSDFKYDANVKTTSFKLNRKTATAVVGKSFITISGVAYKGKVVNEKIILYNSKVYLPIAFIGDNSKNMTIKNNEIIFTKSDTLIAQEKKKAEEQRLAEERRLDEEQKRLSEIEAEKENLLKKAEEDSKTKELLQKEIEMIESKVIFDNDRSTFTLYAFMNFTGYDDENNKQGFHEVRKMIRDDLKKMNLSLRDNNYYSNRKIESFYYIQVLRIMDGAPSFRINQPLSNRLSKLNDLEVHLKEFYEKANIEELFKKYEPYYQKELDKYSEPILPVLANTNKFLNVNSNEIPEFYFQVNLLDAYWRGHGLGTVYAHKGGKGIVITGPSEEANLKNVTHEYLHGIITPVNNELRREINDLTFIMAKVPRNTQASSSAYNSVFSVFDESLIRALDSRYLGERSNYIQNEMRDGFILVEYFDKRFDEFGNYEGTLKDFIRMLIADIKADNK